MIKYYHLSHSDSSLSPSLPLSLSCNRTRTLPQINAMNAIANKPRHLTSSQPRESEINITESHKQRPPFSQISKMRISTNPFRVKAAPPLPPMTHLLIATFSVQSHSVYSHILSLSITTHFDGLLCCNAPHHGRDVVYLPRAKPAHLADHVFRDGGWACPSLCQQSESHAFEPRHVLLLHVPAGSVDARGGEVETEMRGL